MSFIVDVDDLKELSVADAKNAIESSAKLALDEIKLFDLLVTDDKRSAMRHYFFCQ